MIKHFVALWAICLMATLAVAQTKLTITVLDEKSNPLPNASVMVDKVSAKTDERGNTNIFHPSSPSYIRVKHLGFAEYVGSWPANQSSLTVKLDRITLQADEVRVYATRAQQNSATTYKNLSKDDIEKNNLGQDIPYLLDQTPGVIIGSDAGAGIGYTNMTIRGSDNQRINVTINGIPLNDAESMGSFFINLPDLASSIESIQIQRGIGTSTNGAGAFGASLNIQTDAVQKKAYAEFNNSVGSYNSWKNTLKLGSGLINDKFAFNTRLSNITSNGYVERATSDLKSLYFDAGMYTDRHILKAMVLTGKEKTYQAWYGVPQPILENDRAALEEYAYNALGIYGGAEFDRLMNADRRYNYYTYDNQTDNYKQTHAHLYYTLYNNTWTYNVALHYTRGKGYYEEFREADRLAKYGIPNLISGTDTITKSNLIRRRWLDNHFYGTTFSINYKPSNSWNYTLGGAFNQYKGDHYGDVTKVFIYPEETFGDKYYFNDATKNDFNIFLKTDYRVEKWLFNMDLQYRNIHYEVFGDDDKIKNLNFQDKLNFFNPKVGATYFLTQQANVYLSYAYASKEPVRKDYVENPRDEFPKPERMQDIEAGYRLSLPHFSLGSNLYAMLYKDQLIPTGALNDTGGEIRMNIPRSYRIGIELDAAWKISSKFHWSAAATLSRNKIKDFVEYVPVLDDDWNKITELQIEHGDTQIAKAANTILSNNITYSPMENLSFSLLTKYVSRIYLDNTEAKERSIRPFSYSNLQTKYSTSLFGVKNVDFLLSVNNIFNKKYETSGYTWRQLFESKGTIEHYNFYYPQATTNFLFGINIKF